MAISSDLPSVHAPPKTSQPSEPPVEDGRFGFDYFGYRGLLVAVDGVQTLIELEDLNGDECSTVYIRVDCPIIPNGTVELGVHALKAVLDEFSYLSIRASITPGLNLSVNVQTLEVLKQTIPQLYEMTSSLLSCSLEINDFENPRVIHELIDVFRRVPVDAFHLRTTCYSYLSIMEQYPDDCFQTSTVLNVSLLVDNMANLNRAISVKHSKLGEFHHTVRKECGFLRLSGMYCN